MPTHDPRREIEKLRDHFSSHDKPIAFLVGAGASCAARDQDDQPLVPAVQALGVRVASVVAERGETLEGIYRGLERELEEELKDRRPPNIEDILSTLRRKISAMAPQDELCGASRGVLEEIESLIRQTIAAEARPDEARIPSDLPQHALARWISRIDRQYAVEIFTTNYDTLLERGLEDERVPVFDGFVGSRQPFFSSASLQHEEAAPGRRWTRLWKIHGSTNWAWVDTRDGSRRIVRGEETNAGELILPSFYKYDESRKQPYVAMLDRLSRLLIAREGTLLVTIGYSFSDDHINEILFDAADLGERVHILALLFADPPHDHVLVRRALRRRNIIVYGPTAAVVGGIHATWRLVEPVDARTASLLDVPFDSDAEPDPSLFSLTGRFRLGDFSWFARFLDSVAVSAKDE